MTTTTSPAPTDWPGLDLDLGDRAGLVGGDVVLHLHGLEHAHGLTGLDGLADLDEHLHDRALHRAPSTLPLPAAAATAGGRGPPGRRAAPLAAAGDDGQGHVGHPHLDGEALAVDLHVDVALHLRRRSSSPSAGAAPGVALMPVRSSVVLDPLGGVRRRPGSRGGARMARSAGIGGGDPLDAQLLEGADHAVRSRWARSSPHTMSLPMRLS